MSTPLRPIEAQSVVNIAGMKYLVVPHPDPDAVKSSRKKAASSASASNLLPVILKSSAANNEEQTPSFEVEETVDGKLILLPMNATAKIGKDFFNKKKSSMDFSHFQNTLSSGYFAMLHVFKYLNTKDRLSASRVCKLWYQISKHSSLWTSVILKNCRVHSWKNLRDQLNRNGTTRLDLKKLLFSKSEDETWDGFSRDLINAVTTLIAIDLPKISTMSLHSIVQSAKDSPITRLTSK